MYLGEGGSCVQWILYVNVPTGLWGVTYHQVREELSEYILINVRGTHLFIYYINMWFMANLADNDTGLMMASGSIYYTDV